MSDEKTIHSPIQRILVALDASQSSLNALHTAVDLASSFNASVMGLFVEDINLLRLAELPCAREVCFFSAQPRNLKTPEMELELRIQAQRIRNTLAHAAAQLGVSWSFQTARGAVGAEVLAAGAAADLVILGKIGRSLPGMQRSGSTVRTLLMQRQGMTLITETRIRFAQAPVMAVYDGSPATGQTLDIAVYLAASNNAPLIIFFIGAGESDIRESQNRAARDLEKVEIETTFRALVNPTRSGLSRMIRQESLGPVVIPCLDDWFAGERLCGLVEEIPNPVLLIR